MPSIASTLTVLFVDKQRAYLSGNDVQELLADADGQALLHGDLERRERWLAIALLGHSQLRIESLSKSSWSIDWRVQNRAGGKPKGADRRSGVFR